MDAELIAKFNSIRSDLEHALMLIKPDNTTEWSIFEKLIQANKILRTIDFSEVAQGKLQI